MNAENFVDYLKNPSLLYQLSYQELKSLALQYPYCQNLHLLLLQKSRIDQNKKNWKQELEKVAIYSNDRQLLFQRFHMQPEAEIREENILLQEDYLELKDLSALDLASKSELTQSVSEAPSSENSKMELHFEPTVDEEPSISEEQEEELFDLDLETIPTSVPSDLPPEQEAAPEIKVDHDEEFSQPSVDQAEDSPIRSLIKEAILTASGIAQLDMFSPAVVPVSQQPLDPSDSRRIDVHPMVNPDLFHIGKPTPVDQESSTPENTAQPTATPSPRPKKSFTTWIEQFQPPQVQEQLMELMESKKMEEKKKKKKKKKKKFKKMHQLAIESIIEQEGVASETLAEIHIEQGSYDKAIAMYEELMLLIPEKSGFFAEKIEALKKL